MPTSKRERRPKKKSRVHLIFWFLLKQSSEFDRSMDEDGYVWRTNTPKKKDCSRCACWASDAHVRDLQAKYVFRVLGIPCLYDHREQHTKIIRLILFKLAAHFYDEANETSVASHRWIRWRWWWFVAGASGAPNNQYHC